MRWGVPGASNKSAWYITSDSTNPTSETSQRKRSSSTLRRRRALPASPGTLPPTAVSDLGLYTTRWASFAIMAVRVSVPAVHFEKASSICQRKGTR